MIPVFIIVAATFACLIEIPWNIPVDFCRRHLSIPVTHLSSYSTGHRCDLMLANHYA
jgi:hypothetical protein